MLTQVAGFLECRKSFAIETTLSGKNYIETMRGARKLGFAAHLADFVAVFDNSTAEGYQEVAMIEDGSPVWFEPIPDWAKPLKASFD